MTAAEVKRIRLKYGLTQEDFARALGMGLKTIARYETGLHPQHAPAKLLRVIDRHPDVLMYFLEDQQ